MPPLSASEIKEAIGALPQAEQAEIAAWLMQKCEPAAPCESEAVIEELTRRKQEYLDPPEKFEKLDANGIKEMCDRIRSEIQSPKTSAT